MHNRDSFVFFSSKEKLALRETCKTMKQMLKQHQEAPYHNKVEFIIAIDGMFTSEKYLKSAWKVYNTTMLSSSIKPAILYKLLDGKSFQRNGTFTKFADNESLENTGRRYFPSPHVWDVNQVWMLAQFHQGRSFVLYSELSPQYIKATSKPHNYSALAKEVATAIKAGYTISITQEGLARFKPSNDQVKKLRIVDVTVDHHEIGKSIMMVNDLIFNTKREIFCKAELAVRTISDILDILKTKADLTLYHESSIEKMLIDTINDFYTNAQNKKLALDYFIKLFNEQGPVPLTVLNDRNQPKDIMDIRHDLIELLEHRVSSIQQSGQFLKYCQIM